MHIWLLVATGVLSFLLLADKSRFRELYPSLLYMVYFRFTGQYILVEILHVWTYKKLSTPFAQYMNIPVFVDLFFYPAMGYLYIQYYPKTRPARLLYAITWATAFTINEQIAVRGGIIEQQAGWHPFFSFLFFMLMLILLIVQHRFYSRRRHT